MLKLHSWTMSLSRYGPPNRVSFVVVWVHAALSTLRSTTTLRAPSRQLELVNNTTMGGTRLCTSHLATQVPLLYNVQEHSRSNGRPYFSVERTEIYCLTVPPHLWRTAFKLRETRPVALWIFLYTTLTQRIHHPLLKYFIYFEQAVTLISLLFEEFRERTFLIS